MKIKGRRRGVEKRRVPAERCHVPTWQLTSNEELESQHTYYDICPWNHEGRYLTFSSAPIDGAWVAFGHDTLACPEGRVNVLDTETGEIRELLTDAVYMKHGGTFCLWHPSRNKIYFRQDEHCFGSWDLETGERAQLPARVRQLSPDGEEFATILRAPHTGSQGAAIGIVSEDGSDSRELVDRRQLYEITPNREEFRPDDMLLGNTKWHPGGDHLLITMWVYDCPGTRRSLYIVTRDGSEMRWLTHFAHHHSWTPDGACVLFNDRISTDGGTEPRMFLINFDGTNRRIAFDRPVGSHPLMHPDGSRILDADRQGIYVARLEEGTQEHYVDFSGAFDTTHHGTHPHPVWNRDGTDVLYNSAETGHSEIYCLTCPR
jgi:hypothetical protein